MLNQTSLELCSKRANSNTEFTSNFERERDRLPIKIGYTNPEIFEKNGSNSNCTPSIEEYGVDQKTFQIEDFSPNETKNKNFSEPESTSRKPYKVTKSTCSESSEGSDSFHEEFLQCKNDFELDPRNYENNNSLTCLSLRGDRSGSLLKEKQSTSRSEIMGVSFRSRRFKRTCSVDRFRTCSKSEELRGCLLNSSGDVNFEEIYEIQLCGHYVTDKEVSDYNEVFLRADCDFCPRCGEYK